MKLISMTFLLVLCMGIMACAATPRYRITQATPQPSGEAVNGLKLSISAEKTHLGMKLVEHDKSAPKTTVYEVDPAEVALTFTNVSDKAIKLNLYEPGLETLKADLTGPDNKSVTARDENGLFAHHPKGPTLRDYPILNAGKSLTVSLSFPPTWIGGIRYELHMPGEYRLKICYIVPNKIADPRTFRFAEGSWAGSVVSNEIVLKCLLSESARGELYKGVDYNSFIGVAAIDPPMAEHVKDLLEANGIPNIIEGSVVYGVSVPPAMKDSAIAVLKVDSEKEKYYIKF